MELMAFISAFISPLHKDSVTLQCLREHVTVGIVIFLLLSLPPDDTFTLWSSAAVLTLPLPSRAIVIAGATGEGEEKVE